MSVCTYVCLLNNGLVQVGNLYPCIYKLTCIKNSNLSDIRFRKCSLEYVKNSAFYFAIHLRGNIGLQQLRSTLVVQVMLQ